MTKTLTQHLQAIKDSKQGIFVPYIMAGDHEKGLDGLLRPSSSWKKVEHRLLKWGFHGRTL